jgi:hypothetical protein
LRGVVVLIVEGAVAHLAEPEVALEEPAIGGKIAAPVQLEGAGIELVVREDRGRIPQRRVDALGVVREAVLAARKPVARAELEAALRGRER